MKSKKKLIIIIVIALALLIVAFIIMGVRAIWKEQQLEKFKENLLGNYNIEEITYLSLYSSQSLDYAKEKNVGKLVSIKEDGLIIGDKEIKDEQYFVSEMTKSDWKDYHDKYDFGVGENKNKTVFDDKLTYYKAVIGRCTFIFREREIYMLDNLTIFKLNKKV